MAATLVEALTAAVNDLDAAILATTTGAAGSKNPRLSILRDIVALEETILGLIDKAGKIGP